MTVQAGVGASPRIYAEESIWLNLTRFAEYMYAPHRTEDFSDGIVTAADEHVFQSPGWSRASQATQIKAQFVFSGERRLFSNINAMLDTSPDRNCAGSSSMAGVPCAKRINLVACGS